MINARFYESYFNLHKLINKWDDNKMSKKDELKALREEMEVLRQKVYSACIEENKTNNLTFGEAIEKMLTGSSVTRESWNNNHIYVYLIRNLKNNKFSFSRAAEFRVKTIQGMDVPWTPNTQEMLAKDWRIALDMTEQTTIA